MDTIGSFLSGIGLFLCVGAVVVLALVVFAVRGLSGRRNVPPTTTDVWQERGPEQPRYDDPEIRTSGGFGGVPTTGPVDRDDRDFPTLNPNDPNYRGAGFGGTRPAGQRPVDDDEDDNIRSSGGFGS